MKTRFIQTRWPQRVAVIAATAMIAGTPFLTMTQSVQADPPSHAPAWGYRNKTDNNRDDYKHGKKHDKKRDKNRRDDRRDRRDRRDDNDRWNRNNRDDRWNRNDRNDRNGRYDRNDRNNDWGREGVRYNFDGVVTSEQGNGRFVMRASNGRTVTVVARQRDQVNRLDRGDRVMVAGYFRNGIFDAEDLNIVNYR